MVETVWTADCLKRCCRPGASLFHPDQALHVLEVFLPVLAASVRPKMIARALADRSSVSSAQMRMLVFAHAVSSPC